MAEIQVTTNGGGNGVLQNVAIEEFRASLRGELVLEGDAAYEDARQVYNGMIDKRPAIIVRCTDVADVIAAVNFGRENNLLISVRGGGHTLS